MSGTARCVRQLLFVVIGLAACAVWVERSFVPHWLAPLYRDRFPILSDHTRGANVGILFELLPPPANDGRLRVVMIGDSSIGGGMFATDYLPWMLQQQLAERFPSRTVEVIDMSFIGLRAQEALVMMAKAFASKPDLVVYAMSPRIAPDDSLWATSVRDLALEWDVVSRLGGGTALRLLDAGSIGRTLVYSTWAPMRLRVPLAQALDELCKDTLLETLAHAVLPTPQAPPQPPDPTGSGAVRYVWDRAHYRLEPGSPNVRALDDMIGLCAREGRCLLYHIPINPRAVLGFEDDMVETFAQYVGARATPAGVPYRDFRSAGRPENFRTTRNGRPDAIHPTKDGQQFFASRLVGAVADIVMKGESGVTRRRAPVAWPTGTPIP